MSNKYVYDSTSKLSGIEINQDKENGNTSTVSATQEFYLSNNYKRSNFLIPEITGFQFLTNYIDSSDTSLTYSFEYNSSGSTWVALRSGVINSTNGPKLSGTPFSHTRRWFTVRFEPLELTDDQLKLKFRFKISGNSSSFFNLYYQSPSPVTNYLAYAYDGTTALVSGQTASLAFRLLTLSADAGTDFLGNDYRSYVHRKTSNNVTDINNNYWLSKPNPSKFAVENLYFDLSVNASPVTLDSLLLDPVTPNVYFQVYYSNDSNPGFDDASWEALTWKRVPRTFKATKKDVYVFPAAISAKYIKIEFSHLQAKYYAPGAFQKPILYKKHPQWVFDYFIAFYEYKNNKTYDPFIQGQVSVEYDVLNLGYNYYKGDIIQSPNGPVEIQDQQKDQTLLLNLLTDHRIHSNQPNGTSLNLETLKQIKTAFNQFTTHPTTTSTINNTVANLASTNANSSLSVNLINGRAAPVQNYPLENISLAQADTSQVSTINRDALILEKDFPVMFFYIDCNHNYKEAYAKFEDDKAYFAGIKNIVFQRNNHAVQNDEGTYMYATGTFDLNVKRNDFTLDNEIWKSV